MDFILSLTHFCEVHGPKSVLCTQILPLACNRCVPPTPSIRTSSSASSINTEIRNPPNTNLSTTPPSLQQPRTNETSTSLPTNFSAASTSIESAPASPTIEGHPNFIRSEHSGQQAPFPYGTQQSETCASCSFTVPDDVQKKLPVGAPGSAGADGKGKNGSPVLRSRGLVHACDAGSRFSFLDTSDNKATPHGRSHGSSTSSHTASQPSSVPTSSSEDSTCHNHELTYLTLRSPPLAEKYALLRAAVIRTLSCEALPHGTTSGPFAFGDSVNGYTIAYVFRLPDPKARGRRRNYAFMALAGTDSSRAFRACPLIWRMFTAMAESLNKAAEFYQAEQTRKEVEQEEKGNKAKGDSAHITNVSAFLTRRTVDPDGHPRRAGGITPRSLAEIIGNEMIFAEIHRQFSVLLQKLGELLGGLPLNEPLICHSMMSENSKDRPTSRSDRAAHSEQMATSMGKLSLDQAGLTSKGKRALISASKVQSRQHVIG
ncbi:MAG: hypothetical protein Q9227_005061 [Pyrenula ochraceoflavens]